VPNRPCAARWTAPLLGRLIDSGLSHHNHCGATSRMLRSWSGAWGLGPRRQTPRFRQDMRLPTPGPGAKNWLPRAGVQRGSWNTRHGGRRWRNEGRHGAVGRPQVRWTAFVRPCLGPWMRCIWPCGWGNLNRGPVGPRHGGTSGGVTNVRLRTFGGCLTKPNPTFLPPNRGATCGGCCPTETLSLRGPETAVGVCGSSPVTVPVLETGSSSCFETGR